MHKGRTKESRDGVRTILDNLNQGLLMVDKNYTVNSEYSLECIKIFNKRIGNMNIFDLIIMEDEVKNKLFRENIKNIIEKHNPELAQKYIDDLPKQSKIQNKYIRFDYKVIYKADYSVGELFLMIILTDITEKVLTEERLRYVSNHDSLTSLYNRTYLDNILPDFNSNNLFPIGIIFGDMNGLKLTNDVFGHHKGDSLIITMANILKSSCWNDEVIIRWGGDEFIILVFKADQESCEKLCQRIRNICGQSKWDPIEPSISLGIATQRDKDSEFFEVFDLAERNMYKNKIKESAKVKEKILSSIIKILASRCFEGSEHFQQIEDLSVKLADAVGILGIDTNKEDIKILSKLHDIGKIHISFEILGKPSPLLTSEWDIIKSHSEIGYRLAQSIGESRIANYIISIHERWDGEGYPQGLKGKDIPILSRIIAIIEAYDVMTHEHPYKKAMSKEEALAEIESCSGTQFDPELVLLFLKIIFPK